eukprot:COSAG02_NODE_3582_length_6531_cov_4.696206_3_plen_129_part_00
MAWALTISPGFFGVDHLGRQNGLWLSSLTAIGEICRRFLWTLIRIENAHASTKPIYMAPATASLELNSSSHPGGEGGSGTVPDHEQGVHVAVPLPHPRWEPKKVAQKRKAQATDSTRPVGLTTALHET